MASNEKIGMHEQPAAAVRRSSVSSATWSEEEPRDRMTLPDETGQGERLLHAHATGRKYVSGHAAATQPHHARPLALLAFGGLLGLLNNPLNSGQLLTRS